MPNNLGFAYGDIINLRLFSGIPRKISDNNFHKFLIFPAQGLQARSDKFGDFMKIMPMFSHMEAEISQRLPLRLDSPYNFSVEMRPLFPVPYLYIERTLTNSAAVVRTTHSFVRGFPTIHVFIAEQRYLPRISPRATSCHCCLHFTSLLLVSYLIDVKCRLDTSQRTELKKKNNSTLRGRLTFVRPIPLTGFTGENNSVSVLAGYRLFSVVVFNSFGAKLFQPSFVIPTVKFAISTLKSLSRFVLLDCQHA